MWEIYVDRPARRFYRKHKECRAEFGRIMGMLKRDPYKAIYKKPKGKCREYFVARVGDVRVLYRIYDKERVVRVRAAGLRENFYEKYC